MKHKFEKSLRSPLIKRNVFETKRGTYKIDIRFCDGKPFFFKYLNGELVECSDLIMVGRVMESELQRKNAN